MTQEEYKEYERLSSHGKNYYNMGKREHPDWSHTQAMSYAVICLMCDGPGPGPGPGLKEIFLAILKKADVFMQEMFPGIYDKVKDCFTKAYQWVKDAIVVTISKIMELFR